MHSNVHWFLGNYTPAGQWSLASAEIWLSVFIYFRETVHKKYDGRVLNFNFGTVLTEVCTSSVAKATMF
jgi:hypothetical protein